MNKIKLFSRNRTRWSQRSSLDTILDEEEEDEDAGDREEEDNAAERDKEEVGAPYDSGNDEEHAEEDYGEEANKDKYVTKPRKKSRMNQLGGDVSRRLRVC